MPKEYSEEYLQLLSVASSEQAPAISFCQQWVAYCHLFDDLVDGDTAPLAENFVECHNLLKRLMNSEFYTQNKTTLLPNMLLIGEAYAASEMMKKANCKKSIEWSSYLRHAGNDLIRLVALLTGGEQNLNNVSKELRRLSIKDHYDKDTLESK